MSFVMWHIVTEHHNHHQLRSFDPIGPFQFLNLAKLSILWSPNIPLSLWVIVLFNDGLCKYLKLDYSCTIPNEAVRGCIQKFPD
jgi:hypothetical protein